MAHLLATLLSQRSSGETVERAEHNWTPIDVLVATVAWVAVGAVSAPLFLSGGHAELWQLGVIVATVAIAVVVPPTIRAERTLRETGAVERDDDAEWNTNENAEENADDASFNGDRASERDDTAPYVDSEPSGARRGAVEVLRTLDVDPRPISTSTEPPDAAESIDDAHSLPHHRETAERPTAATETTPNPPQRRDVGKPSRRRTTTTSLPPLPATSAARDADDAGDPRRTRTDAPNASRRSESPHTEEEASFVRGADTMLGPQPMEIVDADILEIVAVEDSRDLEAVVAQPQGQPDADSDDPNDVTKLPVSADEPPKASSVDTFLRGLPYAVAARDSGSGRYVIWNAARERLSGIPASRALGKTPEELFGRAPTAEHPIAAAGSPAKGAHGGPLAIVRGDGKTRWTTHLPLRDSETGRHLIVDISVEQELPKAREANPEPVEDAPPEVQRIAPVRQSRAPVETPISSLIPERARPVTRPSVDKASAPPFLENDDDAEQGALPKLRYRCLPSGRLTRVTAAYCELVGADPEEILGGEVALHIPAPEYARLARIFARMGPELTSAQLTHTIVLPNGTRLLYSWTYEPIMDATGKVLEIEATGVPALVQGNEDHARSSGGGIDPLTGLPNRAHLLELLDGCVRRHRRDGSYRYTVLFIDVDRFKMVNDSLGHHRGDEVLIVIAERIQQSLPPHASLARIGSDEFVVVLEGDPERSAARAVARDIQSSLRAPLQISDGRVVYLTASVGIAADDPSQLTGDDVLRDADLAMNRAKRELGSGSFAHFDPSMHRRAVARLQMEHDLRRALEDDEFCLDYQPIVSCDRPSHIAGLEALIRWNHPERGLLGPGQFLGVAEESDLIVRIGWWTLDRACYDIATWMKELKDRTIPPVSINFSAGQFIRPELSHRIIRALDRHALPPTAIKIEITESVFVQSRDAVFRNIAAVQRLGIRLDIDDFGTGYSSFAYLHKLAASGLKIDRSFIQRIGGAEDSGVIIRAIMDIARHRNMSIIAEGVETPEQLEWLQRERCEFVQGFLLGRPVPDAAVTALLSSEPSAVIA